MNKMQKEFIKNGALILGSIIYVALVFTGLALGGGWFYWSAIMAFAILIPLSVYIVYLPIATFVWHWRLMGACITDEDEEQREGAEDLRTRLMCVKKPKWI